MITALDTSVILDVVGAEERFGAASLAALKRAAARGSLVVCDVVWAEASWVFADGDEARRVLARLDVSYVPLQQAAAERAGAWWQAYRRAGGPRECVVADFLIAAHAHEQADVLLTRDRGLARDHFDGLRVEDPTA